jgi:hypothetical protein
VVVEHWGVPEVVVVVALDAEVVVVLALDADVVVVVVEFELAFELQAAAARATRPMAMGTRRRCMAPRYGRCRLLDVDGQLPTGGER